MALTQISTQGIKDGTITGTDLATNVDLVDSQKIRIGTGNDLQIFHSGTHSFMENSTGILAIRSDSFQITDKSNNHAMITATADGAAELYYDNSKKFETTSIGVDITGTTTDDGARHDGDVYFIGGTSGRNAVWDMSDNALEFADSAVASFGDSSDFRIFHNGSDSVLQDQGTGSLIVLSNRFHIKNAANNESLAQFIENGAVELYHNNLLRFQTTSDGCQLQSNTTDAVFSLRSTAQDGAPVLQFLSDDFDDTADAWRLRADGGGTAFGIQNKASGSWENSIVANENGNVKLYYDNSKKFETTSNGAIVTGSLGVDELYMGDNEQIKIGAEDDFLIYHGGSENVLDGVLHKIELRHGSEKHLVAHPDGAVELYHDNSKKFETTSSGVQVTGRIDILGTGTRIDIADNGKIILGDGNDLQIYHSGSGSFIQDSGTGNLNIASDAFRVLNAGATENMITADENGAVSLYYNNVKQFETVAGGAKITGGDGHSLTVENGGTNQGGVINLSNTTVSRTYTIAVAGNTGSKGANSSLFFADATAGVTRFELTSSGHLLPFANNTYDLGSTSKRWRNVYTNDLNLSNEGSSNDVDGTWGSYTIQEGAEDLFLVNKRNGKKYKFNLTEVS